MRDVDVVRMRFHQTGTGYAVKLNSSQVLTGIAFTSVYLEREQYFTMELFDITGNNCGTVYGGTGMSGKNVISINTKSLTAGSYYLVLNLHGKKYMNSFIIE